MHAYVYVKAFLGKQWTQSAGDELMAEMMERENRTERFRLPSGQEIVISKFSSRLSIVIPISTSHLIIVFVCPMTAAALVRLSTGVWQVVSHALCGILLALLRRLPFVPKHLKSKRWC